MENRYYNDSSINIITINYELNIYRELLNNILKILKFKNGDILDESWRNEIIKTIQKLLPNNNNNNMGKSKNIKMICRQDFFKINSINNVNNLKTKQLKNVIKTHKNEQFCKYPTLIKNKKERSQPKSNNILLLNDNNIKVISNIKPANNFIKKNDFNIEYLEKIEKLLTRYNRHKSAKRFFSGNKYKK